MCVLFFFNFTPIVSSHNASWYICHKRVILIFISHKSITKDNTYLLYILCTLYYKDKNCVMVREVFADNSKDVCRANREVMIFLCIFLTFWQFWNWAYYYWLRKRANEMWIHFSVGCDREPNKRKKKLDNTYECCAIGYLISFYCNLLYLSEMKKI